MTVVKCRMHGPMKHRFELDWWECLGFDGEGPRDCGVMIIYAEDIELDTSSIPGIEVVRDRPAPGQPGPDRSS